MKKQLLITIICLASFGITNAQELGVRFGDVSGGNVAIDAVFGVAKYSRLHADVSVGNGLGADLLWDFLYLPLGNVPFSWYVGAGPYAVIGDPFWLGAVGEIGLEYKFKSAPITLGLDWRPQLSIVQATELHAGGFGFNVRYRFGN